MYQSQRGLNSAAYKLSNCAVRIPNASFCGINKTHIKRRNHKFDVITYSILLIVSASLSYENDDTIFDISKHEWWESHMENVCCGFSFQWKNGTRNISRKGRIFFIRSKIAFQKRRVGEIYVSKLYVNCPLQFQTNQPF